MSTKLGTILADFTTALSTDIAVGGTTATLSSATDDDGVALPSGRYFFTLDGSNSNKEHISCDLVGTALTNIKSLSRQGIETTGVVRKHRIGTSVSLTDFGHIKFINDLISGTTTLNSLSPLGYDGAPSTLSGNQLATVTYVLGVVNGGTVTFDQQIISNQTSGEALAINDIVYFKESDQRWYKADADLTTTFDQLQIGINKTTAGASGVTIQVAISGPVSGFTGLTAGSKYYLSNTAGAITTTAGTNSVFIGWALNSTTLLFNPILKTLPTQKEKDALVGSQGVVSSTNKYISQDNVYTSGIDQSQTTQNTTIETGEANATTKRNKVAQSFTAGKTKVRGFALWKTANTGTFTGTVTVSLQADTAGSPSGTALLTKTLTNAEYNALLVGAFDVMFSSEYSSLVLGSTYWIVIETSTSDTSNHPNLGTNSAGGYAGGSVKSWNTTDGWSAVATIDMYFKTYEGINNQVISTDSTGKIPQSTVPMDNLVGAKGLASSNWLNFQLPFIANGTTTPSVSDSWQWYNANLSGGDYQFYNSYLGFINATITGVSVLSRALAGGFVLSKKTYIDFSMITSSDRFFVGLCGSQPGTLSFASVTSRIGFERDNAVSKLYAVCANGTTKTVSEITGITLSNMNNFRIFIDKANSTCYFLINGVIVANITSTIPSTVPNTFAAGQYTSGSGTPNTITAPTFSIEI